MSSTQITSFYDIEPLRDWLEQDVPIVTPNFRLARRIKLAWGQDCHSRGMHSWPTPRVMPLEHWWHYCATQTGRALKLATDAQELVLWQQSIEQTPQSAALLRPRAAAETARGAWNTLQLWQVDPRQNQHLSLFQTSADTALFLNWLEAFQAKLSAAQLELLPEVARELASSHRVPKLVLAEFDELQPLYDALLSEQADDLVRYSHPVEPRQVTVCPCADTEDEFRQAVRWARTEQASGARSIAILVPDLGLHRQRIERVIRDEFDCHESTGQELPVNMSGGTALSAAGPVRNALDLLSLHDASIPVETLVKLLHSRYRHQQEREAELLLIERLYRNSRETVSTSDLRHWANTTGDQSHPGLLLGSQLLTLSQRRDLQQNQAPGDWPSFFMEVLETLGWPGPGSLGSLEFQQIEHFYKALERLRELGPVCGKIPFLAALGYLREFCASAVFQPQTSESSIQVLGTLEAAGLQFDGIWICAMGAGDWPPPAAPNPFIPIALQRSLHMPHADSERERLYATSLLNRFRSSNSRVMASFAAFKDESPQQASALLREAKYIEPPAAAAAVPASWVAARNEYPSEQVIDERAPAIAPTAIAGISGGSGLIADQSQCPFRAFSHHRLKTRALPELSFTLTAAERGELLHDSLFEVWGELSSQETLLQMPIAQRQLLCDRVSGSVVASWRSKRPGAAGDTYLDVEAERLAALLLRWLQVEEKREPFTVVAREEECELLLGELSLKLRIDRIDELANGDWLLIDYKSGNGQIGAWIGERPEQPQLPLYSAALGEKLGGVSFALVRAVKPEYRGISRASAGPGVGDNIARVTRTLEPPLEDWDALRDHWHVNLQALSAEFLDGVASVSPLTSGSSGSCQYCGLQALCRIGEATS